MNIILKRTNADDPDFKMLAGELELELQARDGDDYLFYAHLNKIARIDQVIIAYDQDVPIGCGGFRNYEVDAAEIKRMYVRQANRGGGVASKILSELEKWSGELGLAGFVLETGKNQPEAIAFYNKHGYKMVPNFGKYLESKNSVCFTKALTLKA